MVAMLLGEVFGAASHFHLRLPELFCGFERQPGEPPIAYPVACLPQAWAAGSWKRGDCERNFTGLP